MAKILCFYYCDIFFVEIWNNIKNNKTAENAKKSDCPVQNGTSSQHIRNILFKVLSTFSDTHISKRNEIYISLKMM